MDLEIGTTTEGDTCIVTITGEVDIYTSPKLKETLEAASADGCRLIVVNLGGVGFIDSSGLGVLVGALRRARENDGAVRLVSADEAVARIFRITGLDAVLPLYATVGEALGA